MLANRIKQQGDARCMIALALAYENIPSLRHQAKAAPQEQWPLQRPIGECLVTFDHFASTHQHLDLRIWQIISQTCALWTSRTILSKPMLCL
jgi:hypothetical protein